ncbi:alanine--glyoxylate aminotransferase-like [Sycon ciliatum]|uniref:alanine--glyoxylate aminotransferase-like n=1 Tax=Sycon ciliatum TaxID=27933 RepID=UPI0031F6BCFC
MSSSCRPPDPALLRPLEIPQKTLLGPGPSNCPPRVLAASARPVLGHLHGEFVTVMSDVQAGLRYAFQTQNEITFVVDGSGHAGMEVTLGNLVDVGDVVLVATNGLWGQRASNLVTRLGGVPKQLTKPVGEVFSADEVETALKAHRPSVMFITQGESSAGTLQPVESLGSLCRLYNCLLVVDTVASLGAVPFFTDRWGVDAVYTGSQKVLNCPSGLAPVSFSPRAWRKYCARKKPLASFYFDLRELGTYWAFPGGGSRKYHHTASINSYYALREGLSIVAEEGLETMWERHASNAQRLWSGVERMNMSMAVANKHNRLPTVNVITVPKGVSWKAVSDYANKEYRLEIAGGLGPSAGKVWRVGLMGYNCTRDNVDLVLRVLKEAMEKTSRAIPQSLL